MTSKNVTRPASKVSDARAFSRRYDTSTNHINAHNIWFDHDDAVLDGADDRTAARAKRSPQQQLKVLDDRLGRGVGARNERAKLESLIDVVALAA